MSVVPKTTDFLTRPKEVTQMKLRLEAPQAPVMSNNESNAALLLARHLLDNVVERGDVPKKVFELAFRLSQDDDLRELKHPTGKDADALYAAIETGFLPTFHGGSSKEEAAGALRRLIAVNATLQAEGGH
jgi:hypothetical protein